MLGAGVLYLDFGESYTNAYINRTIHTHTYTTMSACKMDESN